MRYYDIKIFYPQAQPEPEKPERNIYKEYSSLRNGVFNPGNLMIEFDILKFGESTPQGQSHLTIWGISPQDMQQARQDMFGMEIEIYLGMSKGLPLANAGQVKPGKSGLVLKGTIWQVYGNWQGTELRLDMIITTGPVSKTDPRPLAPINLTLPWNKGKKLSVALTQCFQTLGGYKYNINVSNRLVNSYNSPMFCGSLTELATKLNSLSRNIISDSNYSGVEIAMVNGNEIRVFDNDFDNHPDSRDKSTASNRRKNPTQLEFTDLIGQPTWIQFQTISVPCMMRSDIQVGDYIRMPEKSRPVIQASSYSQFRNDSAFSGDFMVKSVRFIGNSRQPDADSWVTIIEANPI